MINTLQMFAKHIFHNVNAQVHNDKAIIFYTVTYFGIYLSYRIAFSLTFQLLNKKIPQFPKLPERVY